MALLKFVQFAPGWLSPKMEIERWALFWASGISFLSLIFSRFLRKVYSLPSATHRLTSQIVSRDVLAASAGTAVLAPISIALTSLHLGARRPRAELTRSEIAGNSPLNRQQRWGPKIVAIGGGHGLSVLLRGVKNHTRNASAIITVADDGGSSGKLHNELGVLPPGDFRNCLTALADDEALMTQLFQYRFGNGSGLDGHSFGNLFITAMAAITGSSEQAILESGHVLAIQGQVLPSTLHDVTLRATLRDSANRISHVSGESQIPRAYGEIERVYLEPDDAPAYPGALRALLDADLIVAGPGSLYTSILPNLLVGEVAQAVAASQAVKVYVCNVATQLGETDGYVAGDHVDALEAHVGAGFFPIVLANSNQDVHLDAPDGVELVRPTFPSSATYEVITTDLVDPSHPWRHDSNKLAQELLRLL